MLKLLSVFILRGCGPSPSPSSEATGKKPKEHKPRANNRPSPLLHSPLRSTSPDSGPFHTGGCFHLLFFSLFSLCRFFYANSFRYGFVNVRRIERIYVCFCSSRMHELDGSGGFEILFLGKIEKLKVVGILICRRGWKEYVGDAE